MITRFAPSPTGFLHLGHAYSALCAWEFAKRHSGQFYLRFEDIDHNRVRPEYYHHIESDLHWLGLAWPTPAMRQLDRLDAYQDALETLKSLHVLYPCFCTRREVEKELAHLTHAPHGPEGAHYPGACKNLSSAEKASLFRKKEAAWRLDTKRAAELTGSLTFHDLLQGTTTVDPYVLGDPILARRDIGTSYHLAVVIDDAHQEITHVIRGEDLHHACHLHRLLQKLLHLPEPTYLHHPLITDHFGKRLAKRNDSLSLQTLRSQGTTLSELLTLLPPFPKIMTP